MTAYGLPGHNPTGAGAYGRELPSHVTACVNSKNPFGHNPECGCGWWEHERAEQAALPVLGSVYPESPYADL